MELKSPQQLTEMHVYNEEKNKDSAFTYWITDPEEIHYLPCVFQKLSLQIWTNILS